LQSYALERGDIFVMARESDEEIGAWAGATGSFESALVECFERVPDDSAWLILRWHGNSATTD
jgi:hypothetical protein